MGGGGEGEEKRDRRCSGRRETGGENEEKRIDILKRFAGDLGWNACQIRKTSLVYFTNPRKKDNNETFDL